MATASAIRFYRVSRSLGGALGDSLSRPMEDFLTGEKVRREFVPLHRPDNLS